jgi:hypothetical protein
MCGKRVLVGSEGMSIRIYQKSSTSEMSYSLITQGETWNIVVLHNVTQIISDVMYTVKLRVCFAQPDQDTPKYCLEGLDEGIAMDSSLSAPVVSINGGGVGVIAERTIAVSDRLSLTSSVYVFGCDGYKSSAAIFTYSWIINDVLQATPPLRLPNSANLDLNAFSLMAGQTYIITLIVAAQDSKMLNGNSTIFINVKQSPPVAIMSPSMPIWQLKLGNMLVLDASSSYDPDSLSVQSSSSNKLRYQWSCWMLPSKKSCLFSIVPKSLGASMIRIVANSSLSTELIGSTSIVTLTVFNNI